MISLTEQMKVIQTHQATAPVEVMPIATDLGLHVYNVTSWPDDLSGMIVKDATNPGGSGYAIYVNGNHPPVRRRFTIAHEIAHFILHTNDIGDGIVDDGLYRSKLSNAKEAQANAMAADILMPWHLIRQAMQNGNNTVEALAAVLNVSRSAMSIRLGVPYETRAPANSLTSTPEQHAS